MTLELGYETTEKPPFKYAAHTRVGFSDTDAQGIVYYGRYVPYFDLARVEYHRHLGLTRADWTGTSSSCARCTSSTTRRRCSTI